LSSPPAETAADAPAALDTILALLHEHTRHDLALYKSNTLVRRIARRIAVHGLDSMAAYAEFLRANAQELDLLFKEMLIGVTSFFRDPEVWQDLQDKVLPVLIERHAQQPARCAPGWSAVRPAKRPTRWPSPSSKRWTPLPASAARAADLCHRPERRRDRAARTGRFGATIAQDLTPQRLSRFFTERPDGYQIDKRIRDMVLFAQHDVIIDPPFTRLDILSCRNLMIYFGTALQKRLVPLFHYSLRPGGALLLGGSETVGARSCCLCRWTPSPGSTGAATMAAPRQRGLSDPSAPVQRVRPRRRPFWRTSTRRRPICRLADQLLLQSHAPAAVLVNDGGDIVYISGRTGRYLEPAAGKANWNIHVMARPSIRAQLAVALRTALQERARSSCEPCGSTTSPGPPLTSPCRRSCSPGRWKAWR
jgi:two-component system CheB/CheR fusion protein